MNSRQSHILERLIAGNEVSVQDLAARFGVSEMTVRRDLVRLEREGELTRTHGGAVLSKAGVIEFAFKEKEKHFAAEKKAIAREVASFIHPGMTLTLDTGTTTLEVARAIVGIKNLTVLTSSLAIASALYVYDHIELVLLGGTVRKGNPDLSGRLTEENLKCFRVDLALIGADGADPAGVYTTDMNIACVSQWMISGAAQTVLALDHSKFEKTAFVKFALWDRIDRVITDDGVPPRVRKWLNKSVREVIYAQGGEK